MSASTPAWAASNSPGSGSRGSDALGYVHTNAPVGLGGTNPVAVVDTSNGAAHGPAGGGLTCGELIDAGGLPEAVNPALPLDDDGSDDKAGIEVPTDTEALEDAGAADDAGRLDGFEATSDGAPRPALTALPHAAASRPIAIRAAV
jgi:hypothetical protein